MSPTLTTFLFEAANFLVLALVLSWIFFKPVRQSLADRRAKLDAEDREAAAKLAESEKVRLGIDTARSNLQAELNALRARELEGARKQAEQLLADTRVIAARELDASRRQAARMSETQRKALAEAAAAVAAQTVGQLLNQISGPDMHAALVQSACQQIRDWPHDALLPAKVESAQVLSAPLRAALDEAFGPAATQVDYRTVSELGVGVRISTAHGLIDATSRGLVGFARQALEKEMNHRAHNQHSLHMIPDA